MDELVVEFQIFDIADRIRSIGGGCHGQAAIGVPDDGRVGMRRVNDGDIDARAPVDRVIAPVTIETIIASKAE